MKGKCACIHVGNCPFDSPIPPLQRTYPDGSAMLRELTAAEAEGARLMVAGQALHEPPRGGFVGTDQRGNCALIAMPYDVERMIAYTLGDVGRKCKADSWWWRKRHPIPVVA